MTLRHSIQSTLLSLFATTLIACTDSAQHSGKSRNLFAEYLGKSQAEIDAKIDAAYQQLFFGDAETERLYYPVGDDMAYIWDVGNNDVRSEGISYGMMVAAQLDEKEVFDRLWNWCYRKMRIKDGPHEGYFQWQVSTTGEPLGRGPAPDGEEWFVMALFFASHRWGDGDGIYNYSDQANILLREMLHQKPTEETLPIFDSEYHMVRFVPWQEWDGVTDASYHLPAFYELWADWALQDQSFWRETARKSREFFRKTAHPETGLMPDYSYYKEADVQFGDHKDFRFDAWRIMSNVALDHLWWGKDSEWQIMQSNRILSFLETHAPTIPSQFTVDGQPLSDSDSPGLYAMAATAALAADREIGEPFVRRLWDQPVPAGQWRYYDGLMHLLGLLQVSGKFQIIAPNDG